MKTLDRVEKLAHRVVDRIADARPRPAPPESLLSGCRIVSHRGEHDNRRVIENSLPAFDAAAKAGVWGIELDIRWTRDLCPVIFHDPDLKRIFGAAEAVSELTRADIEKRFPLIPSLEAVVACHGKARHLMIELKDAAGLPPTLWSRALKQALDSLDPGVDYHLLSLDPEIFAPIDWAPGTTFVPIGRLNLGAFSRLALSRNYGGVTGHYQLLSNRMLAVHRQMGQQVGTGFPASCNVMFREIWRGVDWIFSDRAAELQAICNRQRVGSPSGRASRSASARPFSSSTK